MKIAVLGDGAWGTAVSCLLASNGYEVHLWCQSQAVAQSITQNQENSCYLPGIPLPASIKTSDHLQWVIEDATIIFEAIPVRYLRGVLAHCAAYARPDALWVVLSKGIEKETLFVPSQIIDAVLKTKTKSVVLSGPSFAQDVARKCVTGVILASENKDDAQSVQLLLANNYFFTRYSSDYLGVQLAGALKNCIALAVGILQGAGYCDNTKSLVATLALHELRQLLEVYTGTPQTAWDLAGLGDTLLTAFGSKSKNVALGSALGQGKTLAELTKENVLPEGINTLSVVSTMMEKKKIRLPIFQALADYIFHAQSVEELTKAAQQHMDQIGISV